MIITKNYENICNFVKVMYGELASFAWHGVVQYSVSNFPLQLLVLQLTMTDEIRTVVLVWLSELAGYIGFACTVV